MRETNKSRAAFEDYYNMGPARSLRLLHKEYRQQTENKPPTKRFETIAQWSTVHGWQDRVAKRDKEIADNTLAELKSQATETGYAIFQKRIIDLGKLAEMTFKGLVSTEKPYNYLPAIKEFRGLLSDIAAEMGERRKEHKIQIDVDRKLMELLEEHGLTYEDIRNDPLLYSLFVVAGIPVAGITPDETGGGEETTRGA
jgi:hypothetical protein